MDEALGSDDEPQDQDTGGESQLAWRETYVVLFHSDVRPTLTQVEAAVGGAGGALRMDKLQADEDGLFRSVLVQAPEDNAVLDIRYEAGEAITERAITLVEQMRDDLQGDQMDRLLDSDAWLEIMHFEKVTATESDEDPEDPMGPEGLDPATLITVVETLAHLTGGLPVDPEAGEVVVI